jgi:hypothetical protein
MRAAARRAPRRASCACTQNLYIISSCAAAAVGPLLHHFLSMILLTQTVQSLFQVIEYTIMNKYGTLLFSFIFISLLFSVMRNTFGRVLTLLVSLGTGITRP